MGITFDERNRAGIVEPVCTHPDHRRKGLAIELIREGLRRLEERGAETVWVDTGLHMDANALYERAGFDEPFVAHTWRFTD